MLPKACFRYTLANVLVMNVLERTERVFLGGELKDAAE